MGVSSSEGCGRYTVCKIRCGGYHLVRDVDDTLSVR